MTQNEVIAYAQTIGFIVTKDGETHEYMVNSPYHPDSVARVILAQQDPATDVYKDAEYYISELESLDTSGEDYTEQRGQLEKDFYRAIKSHIRELLS